MFLSKIAMSLPAYSLAHFIIRLKLHVSLNYINIASSTPSFDICVTQKAKAPSSVIVVQSAK